MRFGFDHHDRGGHHAHHAHPHRHEFGPGGPGRHRHDHDWSMERGEQGRRRVFDAGELRLVLLKLIADQPRHGYDLIRAIEELTGGAYVPSPGVVYPALSLLEDMGHIAESESEGARKAFASTVAGQAELAANVEKVNALLARLAALAAVRDRMDALPVRRAMENLRTVLKMRLGGGETAKETVHDIAAILDEAARKIERL
jgi:DNA-binding PadR family transcriptional regulator